jgi:hypothetical protein
MGWVPDTLIFRGNKKIGPTFYSEVEAYGGLMGEHWTTYKTELQDLPTALEFFKDTPKVVIDGVLEVYAAHMP